MADPFHHAVSSARRWGGEPEDFIAYHFWFDQTKQSWADPRHRAMRHHAEGIQWMMDHFAKEATDAEGNPVKLYVMTTSQGKEIPLRWIGEQHVLEDLGWIPSVKDWLEDLPQKSWMMTGARRLSQEFAENKHVPVTLPSEVSK